MSETTAEEREEFRRQHSAPQHTINVGKDLDFCIVCGGPEGRALPVRPCPSLRILADLEAAEEQVVSLTKSRLIWKEDCIKAQEECDAAKTRLKELGVDE